MKDTDGIKLYLNGYDGGYEAAMRDIKKILDNPDYTMDEMFDRINEIVKEVIKSDDR